MFGRNLTNEEFIIELQNHIGKIKECLERINDNNKEHHYASMAPPPSAGPSGGSEVALRDTEDSELCPKEDLCP